MRRFTVVASALAMTTALLGVPATAALAAPAPARSTVSCTTAKQVKTCTSAPVRIKRTVTKDARGRTVVTTVTRYTQKVTMPTRVTTRVFTTTTRAVGRATPVSTTTKTVTVTPVTPKTTTPAPMPTAPKSASQRAAAFENEIVRLVNVERAKAGLAPMTRDARIDAVAREWSQTMARTGKFEHRPDWAWVKTITRYSGAAENIAWGYPTAASMMSGWMNSPGHRRNILNPALGYIGVGVAFSTNGHPYGTQNFMTDVNARPAGPPS